MRTHLKEIIKNPYKLIIYLNNRHLINWFPDKYYLSLAYRAKIGKNLNLNAPKSFNEKIQWLKLYDRNPNYTKMVDKLKVKEYISEKIGNEYIIPTIGVYNKSNEINFNELPNQFVIKCTHDSGSTIVCKNKDKFDYKLAKKKINNNLKRNYFYCGREWVYKNIKPQIIIEEYLKSDNIKDYKFMCFNGEPKCILVCSERDANNNAFKEFYDTKWNKLPFGRKENEINQSIAEQPKNLEKMLELSKILAKNIPFVRVDFYEINNKIYFGELTFYPASGFEKFYPEEWDYKLGSWLSLPIGKVDE